MQLFVDPRDAPELDVLAPPENQRVDSATLRILAAWIARRDGLDPELGAIVDRGFVVAQARG
jgi:hypothetical protein